MQHPFVVRLESGSVILADGAMGTQLYARGIDASSCFDLQNIDAPALVESVHRDYIEAGAELIETNTFGANRVKLAAFGVEDRVVEINRRGAQLARGAREISGKSVLVAGSLGPTGRSMVPFGHMSPAGAREVYLEQVEGLLEGGVDLLIFETFSDLTEISAAIGATRELTDAPIVAQMTFTDDLETPHGHSPELVVETLTQLGVDVIGANCSVGPNGLLAVTERLLRAGAARVSAMPNAGWPEQVGNRVLYLSSPHYTAEHARRMADLGASIVGGCCGTTPLHIRMMSRALAASGPSAPVEVVRGTTDAETQPPEDAAQSRLAAKLGTKRVISVEIRPPRGANPARAVEAARLLTGAGVDAVNLVDSAMARVRMSALASAVLIQQQVGVETILHFTTRDRNLMAIQSDLIGGHALGIRNVLALTGDPPSIGDYSQSKAVYDVDSIGLIRLIKQLNSGVDIGGNSIGAATRFLVGCALNPTAEDLDHELGRFRQKLDAGADFVMTQPVYDAELFERVIDAISPLDLPVLMGVLPLQSYQHALFLHNELPGVTLTGDVLRRMEEAGTDGVRAGIEMAREMIDRCAGSTAGVYLMPSFGRYEAAAHLVTEILEPA